MWHYNQSQVSVIVTDGLAPIWHQDICSYHGGISQLAHPMGDPMYYEILARSQAFFYFLATLPSSFTSHNANV